MTEKVQYKKKLALTMASFAFIGFGFLSILTGPTLDLNSITKALIKSFPGMVTLGFLGYLLGNIFDNRNMGHGGTGGKKLVMQNSDIADLLGGALRSSSKKSDSQDTEDSDET